MLAELEHHTPPTQKQYKSSHNGSSNTCEPSARLTATTRQTTNSEALLPQGESRLPLLPHSISIISHELKHQPSPPAVRRRPYKHSLRAEHQASQKPLTFFLWVGKRTKWNILVSPTSETQKQSVTQEVQHLFRSQQPVCKDDTILR